MPFEFVFAVATVFVAVFLFILFLVRIKGEVLRLWGNPVPYFPRMKPNRPLRVKIRRGITQTLNAELVKIFDKVIVKLEKKAVSGNPSVTQQLQLVPNEGVPQDLFDVWLKIRQHPEHYSIYSTFFKRRWRWLGRKGRWVYAYHLFPHDEMRLGFYRHKTWLLAFVPTPIGFHAPTKTEWVKMRLQEAYKQGKKLTPELKRAFEKEYKREGKDKWLTIFIHPLVTKTKQAQVLERLEGFQNFLPIIAFTMRTLGSKLAKFDALLASVKGFKGYELESKRIIEDLTDNLGKTSTVVQNLQRTLKQKRIPIVVSPESSPMPLAPRPPPTEKPSRIKQAFLGEFNWVYATILLGFGMAFFGLLQYSTNPANWGLLGFGTILFMFGVFMWWREKRSKVPLVEEAKETLAETKESLKEEGA